MLASARKRFAQSPAPKRVLRSILSALALSAPSDERLRSIYQAAMKPGPFSPPRTVRMRAQPRLAPHAFEQQFARLQREGRYGDMWPLLAEDAQRLWGTPDSFAGRLRDQAAGVELLDADVRDVDLLSEWTDARAGRTYRNVARLDVRYRVKYGPREWALKRQVHLVPARDGWRALWYPQPE
jgi:hypothetical protein